MVGKHLVAALICMTTGTAWSGVAAGAAPEEAALPAAFQTGTRVADEMLITFDPDTGPAEQEELLAARGIRILHRFETINAVQAVVEGPATTLAAATRTLGQEETVVQVSPNRIFRLLQAPDDPNLSRQYHHDRISSSRAWDITTGSPEITVAIIDTGVIYDHPDLEENYWTNPGESGRDARGRDKRSNGVDDDGNGYIDDFRGWDFADKDNDPYDSHGHGTHCAGSIGARGDNGVGISGVNWRVSLVGLKFIGSSGEGQEADAIRAIEYAIKMGFDITSNSWGGDPDPKASGPDLLQKVIAEAGRRGQLFIAAAGNDGRNTDRKPTLPASYDLDNIISVAASDSRDRLASFSNYGRTTVDLMAPGAAVYSTTRASLLRGPYGSMSGTSMAAPLVAGAAALVKARYPDADAAELKERLLRSVDRVPAAAGKVSTGGRLNLYRALTD